jgi:Flp pilus assembly pilin Flp
MDASMLGRRPSIRVSKPGGLMKSRLNVFRTDEGQGLAEYALILALIAIVAIIALLFLGEQISSILFTIGDSV